MILRASREAFGGRRMIIAHGRRSSRARRRPSLPSWPRSRVLELAPTYWEETLKQEETQQRLAANVLRAVALGEHSEAA